MNGNSVNYNFVDNLKLISAAGPGGNDGNYINHYWEETYNGIKYANTILNGKLDKVRFSDATKTAKGLFHRITCYSFRFLHHGDVPLITKIRKYLSKMVAPKAAILGYDYPGICC